MAGEGSQVPLEDQARHFSSAILNQAAASQVNIIATSRINSRTNQFFMEQSESLNVQAAEENLVDFLYNLGAGSSLIRVRDLSVRPDPSRQQWVSNVKLVASYQKKLPVKPAANTTTGGPRSSTASTATRSP